MNLCCSVLLALCCCSCMERTKITSEMLKEFSKPKREQSGFCQDFYEDLLANKQYNAAYPSWPEFGACAKVDFDFFEEVGRGKYGVVYRGIHRATGKLVAIKHFQFPNASTHDTRREECVQNMIDFPYVRKHYCTFSAFEEKSMYLVMEYIDGENMNTLLKHSGDIPVEQLRLWSAQLSVTLHALHLNGLTYCDLKPENVIVDQNGNLKLIDLGLTRPSNSCIPTMSVPIGTPMSWPPEHFPMTTDKCYSAPFVDWWALGVVLFMIWTKADPYDISCLKQHRKDRHAYLSAFGKCVKAGFKLSDNYRDRIPEFADFIHQLVELDCDKRLGFREEAIFESLSTHPWLTPILPNVLSGLLII